VAAADVDHLRVRIHTDGADASVAEQLEKLATSASEIDHVGCADESVGVVGLPRADRIRRAAKQILKADIASTEAGRGNGLHGERRGGNDRRRLRDIRPRVRQPLDLAAGRDGGALRRCSRHPHFVERRLERARLRVDERCDLLQVLDQDRVERDEGFQIRALRGSNLRKGSRHLPQCRGRRFELLRDLRVELLLARKDRSHEPPHEPRQPAAPTGEIRRSSGQDGNAIADAPGVEIGCGRRWGCRGQRRERTIDVRQRVVVAAIGDIAL